MMSGGNKGELGVIGGIKRGSKGLKYEKNVPHLYNVKEYLLILSDPDFLIGQFFRANEFHKINFQVHFGGRFVLKIK